MPELTILPVADPAAELPPPAETPERISLGVRLVTLVAIIVPVLGLVAAPFFLWGWGFSWVDLGLLLSLYLLTGLGTAVGYHRLFTHRAVEAYTPVEFVVALLGSMALQGQLVRLVGVVRRPL